VVKVGRERTEKKAVSERAYDRRRRGLSKHNFMRKKKKEKGRSQSSLGRTSAWPTVRDAEETLNTGPEKKSKSSVLRDKEGLREPI